MGRKLIQTELAVLRDAIHYVHDETVRGMNEGKDLHTLMQSIELPPELEVGQGYGKVSWVFEQSGSPMPDGSIINPLPSYTACRRSQFMQI